VAWSPVGTGTEFDTFASVNALAVFDDGGGPALYVGGFFTMAGVGATHLAKWDGATWTSLETGFAEETDLVQSLAVFDGGGGPALIVGGHFSSAGGVAASRIASFDGASWSALGAGTNGNVGALAVVGARLYAGGVFTTAGGASARRVASWDGASWEPLGDGLEDAVQALVGVDQGGEPVLYAGGVFDEPVDLTDAFVAVWDVGPDVTPPLIACPASVHVRDSPTSTPGKVVHFTVTATDECDPAPAIVCVPPSGSFFPLGTTIVSCTATDAAGNESMCDFPVLVETFVRRK
jgi:hypothetical protein